MSYQELRAADINQWDVPSSLRNNQAILPESREHSSRTRRRSLDITSEAMGSGLPCDTRIFAGRPARPLLSTLPTWERVWKHSIVTGSCSPSPKRQPEHLQSLEGSASGADSPGISVLDAEIATCIHSLTSIYRTPTLWWALF